MGKDPQHIINLVTRYRNMANKIEQILIVAISLETGRLVGTSTKLNQFYHGGLVTKLCPCDTMDCSLPDPLSNKFSRQEY